MIPGCFIFAPVCVSSHTCRLSQVPVVPDSPESKRNYWKLDSSEITPKMVRRHFKGFLQLFPELASKLETEGRASSRVRFTGSFSISSLLSRESPTAGTSRPSPPSEVQVSAEEQPGSSFGPKRTFSRDEHCPVCSPGGSTHQGWECLVDRMMHVHTDDWWPVSTGTSAAPYFPCPPSSYMSYTLPAFYHDAFSFRL